MNIEMYKGDCLDIMKERIQDKSIDMILCDLPYGEKSRNKWDTVIDFTELWQQYKRIIKDNGAIVLFGQGLFTANLMNSNRKMWRYNLIWQKTQPTGFLNAKKMPLRAHEDIVVFYKKRPIYNPQKTTGHNPVHEYVKHTSDGMNYGETKRGISGGGSTERYPTSIFKFKKDIQTGSFHPTQKPVGLLEYLIKTYTNEGDTVLDNCMGSGSTGVACINTGRNFIGIEKETQYFEIANKRIDIAKGQHNEQKCYI